MDDQEIRANIERALEIFCRTEPELIADEAHEQTIAARLMLHLQHLLPEWHVDVEFTRQGRDREPKRDEEGNLRKPDIIIHRRGSDGPNLALVLVKCEWNQQNREADRRHARSLKRAHGYQIAFVLELKSNDWELTEIH
jgi:hypothetical protein